LSLSLNVIVSIPTTAASGTTLAYPKYAYKHDGGHGHVDIGEAMGLESYICKRLADIIANMTTRER
jgi:hypothetical protein